MHYVVCWVKVLSLATPQTVFNSRKHITVYQPDLLTLQYSATAVYPAQLSPRMQIPGNMWVEVWQSAKPIPARRQRRLFDETKEAEKVSECVHMVL